MRLLISRFASRQWSINFVLKSLTVSTIVKIYAKLDAEKYFITFSNGCTFADAIPIVIKFKCNAKHSIVMSRQPKAEKSYSR